MTRAVCSTPIAAEALAVHLGESGYLAIATERDGVPIVEAECPLRAMERAPSGLVQRCYKL